MKNKKVAAFLFVGLLLVTVASLADTSLGFEVAVLPANIQPGDEVEVMVSLTGYTEEAAEVDGITGIQVDINNVDTSVLEVKEYASLIEDTAALSNTASYQPKKKLARLLYMNTVGTLKAPYEDIMKVTFCVNSDLTESGSITLPVKVLISTENGQQLTLTDELVISYTVEKETEKDTLGFKVSPSSADVNAGDDVEVTVSLTGYTKALAAEDGITGIQVDINNVDTSVLEVIEYASLIEDTTALSNTASNQPNKELVRLLYMNMAGTLVAPYEDIMEVTFRVKSDLTESGSITLPVTVLIQTENGQQLTLTDEIVITYTVEGAEVTSVEISWGAMEFTYTDGTWNPTKHSYEGGGWTDSGSGYIQLSNVGTTAVQATLSYEPKGSNVTGSFVDATGTSVSTVSLNAGDEAKVYLRLSGKPSETMDSKVIGKATVRIGEE